MAKRYGTVWIAWDEIRGEYSGHWERAPTGEPALLEHAPMTADLAEMLAWARSRARRVIVRPPGDPHTHYWAGDGRRPKAYPDLSDAPAGAFAATGLGDDPHLSEHLHLGRCDLCEWSGEFKSFDALQRAFDRHRVMDHPES